VRDGATGDVIAALATAPGRGALAVVRVSGSGARAVVGSVFRGKRRIEDLEGFQGAHGLVVAEEGAVDEVVAWVYREPHSYTGEDLVEISCHGGSLPARRILECLWRAGARPATPGEFTRRAFLNGRMDLAQAEAVADLIAARGARAQAQALVQLEGGLSTRVRALAAILREVSARLTVYLDFEEDVPEPPDTAALGARLEEARAGMERLSAGYEPARRRREGVTVALVGAPNVGKSSLLNRLVGYDRALVHADPGTTRDVVDAQVEWRGVPVRLVDTAGVREGAHPVESEGIQRGRREVQVADAVLWVIDGSRAPGPEDAAVGAGIDPARTVVVANKLDLGASDTRWVNDYSPDSITFVSALTGEGMQALQSALERRLLLEAAESQDDETVSVSRERHVFELRNAVDCVTRAHEVLARKAPVELAAAELARALAALGAITGEAAGPELLDAIFSGFCIGK